MTYAHESAPSTTAGMSSASKDSLRPTVTGSSPHLTPTRYCSTKPMTKDGMAMMISEATRMVESKIPPRRIPAINPKMMPKIASKAIAMSASLMVTGKAFAITDDTGWPENVVPKSPTKMPLM